MARLTWPNKTRQKEARSKRLKCESQDATAKVVREYGNADGRGICIDWECGCCGYLKNSPVSTRMAGPWGRQCDWCGANNVIPDQKE